MQAVPAIPQQGLGQVILQRRMLRASMQQMSVIGQPGIEAMAGHPGRREPFTEARFANALAPRDVMFLNLQVEMVGALQVPMANFTADSIVVHDVIAVVVVTPKEDRPNLVTLVATIPAEAVDMGALF